MITPIFKGYNTKDGKHHVVNKAAFEAYLNTFGVDKEYQIIVRKKRKQRSNAQNNYYFGVVLTLIYDHTGHSIEELHDAFKRKFLKKFNSDGLEFTQSTTDLTTTGMMEYIASIVKFAAEELDVVIPDPDGCLPE